MIPGMMKSAMKQFETTIKPALDKKIDSVKEDVKTEVKALKNEFGTKLGILDEKLDENKTGMKNLDNKLEEIKKGIWRIENLMKTNP